MKILVIDDNPAIAGVIARMLAPLSDSVPPRIVDNVPDAMELLAGERFDLVTLDLRLPGWTVDRTISQISRMTELNGEGLIIVVTGVDDPSLADRVMAAGAHGFIFKPMVRYRDTFFDNLKALALSLTRQPTRYQQNLVLAERLVQKLATIPKENGER